ncbi:MAG: hypothetical protein RJA34_2662 [Pseudomonadota bacterium]|jgi:predicted branched-subunit amino acid permease
MGGWRSLFCVLTVEQWRARKTGAPLWVALSAYALAYPLFPRHALVISIALCVAAAVVLHVRGESAQESQHD